MAIKKIRRGELLRQKLKEQATPKSNRPVTWKQGWRVIGGKRNYYRSKWEANYARYLEFLKQKGQVIDWEHEPDTFWFSGIKRGVCSYLPDFKVTEKIGVHYVEVKGHMDQRSRTKLKRMEKYHPGVDLRLVDKKKYKEIASIMKFIEGWE